MSKNRILYMVAIALVLGSISYAAWKQSGNSGNPPAAPETQKTNSPADKAAIVPGQYEGTLKKTDDVERGNLMLVMPNRVLYINTTRDFDSLIGKEVVMKIEGDFQNFRLISIQAK